MTDVKIATGAEQPLNRHAGLAQYAGVEGELVGLDGTGVVMADADSASTVKARGVLFGPVTDLSAVGGEVEPLIVESNRTIAGRDRVSFVDHGVVLHNNDEDWGFTPGSDVYLAVGGGFTTTNPDPDGSLGHLVQVVGYAIDPESMVLDIDQSA